MILGCMEVLAEGQTLAEKSGIGAEALHDFVKGTDNCLALSILPGLFLSVMHRCPSCRTVRVTDWSGVTILALTFHAG